MKNRNKLLSIRKEKLRSNLIRFSFAFHSLSVRFTCRIEMLNLSLPNFIFNSHLMSNSLTEKILRIVIAIGSALLGVIGGSSL